ncbi:MAG: DNA polymerase III subunit delta' [Desulfobacca sp.]|uniref:DNA polymerase III subunit delta' n=1 Tax=Desulfobacca sp. TaxID=2067990 RepID=UPI004049157D
MFFRDLLGQERVLGLLKQALASGQLPHALLFSGPEGVGKASTALALAQALNCQERQPDQDACGQCRSCRLFAAGTHPDFLLIRPEGEAVNAQIKIEQIRELRRQTGFAPFAGGWRVIVLKPAEAMNEAAANALLKTLEEPPAHNLLILIASGERDLLPTIVSRCRRLVFNALPQSVVVQQLQARRGLEVQTATLVAALHGGSLGAALAADPAALLAERDQMLSDLAILDGRGMGAALDWAAAKAKKGAAVERFLLLAQLWYRDLLVLACQGAVTHLTQPDRLADLLKQQQQVGRPQILQRLQALQNLQRQLRSNVNVELALNAFIWQWRQTQPSAVGSPHPPRPATNHYEPQTTNYELRTKK